METKDTIVQKVGDLIKTENAALMSLRTPLETVFPKKDIDFTFAGAPHFSIKTRFGVLMIVNSRYVDRADLVVNGLAVGYNL